MIQEYEYLGDFVLVSRYCTVNNTSNIINKIYIWNYIYQLE